MHEWRNNYHTVSNINSVKIELFVKIRSRSHHSFAYCMIDYRICLIFLYSWHASWQAIAYGRPTASPTFDSNGIIQTETVATGGQLLVDFRLVSGRFVRHASSTMQFHATARSFCWCTIFRQPRTTTSVEYA